MPTEALISKQAATSTEEPAERRSRKDISAMRTFVATAPTGRICAEKMGQILFAAGRAVGWVAAFLTASTAPVSERVVSPRNTSEVGARIAELYEEIEDMRSLSLDWNGFGSESPNEFAREVAKQITLTATTRMVPDRVAPSAQGGVGICFVKNGKYGDIEVLNNGEILATTSDRTALPEVWEVRPTELKGALDRIVRFLNS